MGFKVSGTKITFEFDNQAMADHFKTWLCESGEQDYWTWMECREQEEDGNITARNFDYHSHPKGNVVKATGNERG